jgi:hypothetical protein
MKLTLALFSVILFVLGASLWLYGRIKKSKIKETGMYLNSPLKPHKHPAFEGTISICLNHSSNMPYAHFHQNKTCQIGIAMFSLPATIKNAPGCPAKHFLDAVDIL